MVDINPLTAKPPEEVLLKNAPLIRVIAQVRFPPILSIEKQDFVGSFQEAIRDKYPILQPEQTQGLVFGTQGIAQTAPQVTWRFLDITESWRVSLAPNFVALETTDYSSRSDFFKRLEIVLIALNENFRPKITERFGLRYIDRFAIKEAQEISKLVRPEIAGIAVTELGEYARQIINESLFIIPESDEQIIARWGIVPAGVSLDSDAIEPVAELSWMLDLDMSLSKNREFSVDLIMEEANRFAERNYTFFRWAVTDEFLRRFGGEL